MTTDQEANAGESKEQSSPKKLLSPVLKRFPSYRPYPEIFGYDADLGELIKKYRFHRPGTRQTTIPMFSQDDCLFQTRTDETQPPQSMKCRLANAAWRMWTQKTYQLDKLNSQVVPTKLPSPWPKRKVCFNEKVDKLILPPLPDPYQLEEEEYVDYDEEPGLIDNLGSVCFNILLTASSFLSPYYSLSSKKFSAWLM